MRQATSQEPVSDSGHSLILETSESNGNSGLKSAAMLGIALSVGASGALIPSPEAAAAVNVPTKAATTEAFSSDTQVATASDGTAVQQIVGYHTVASGESLWQIAQQYRVGLQDLKSANALSPETSISVGQVLKVPAGTALRTTNGTNELAQTEGIKIASAEVNTASDADVRPLATANHSPVSEMAVTPAPAVKVADASVAATQAESAEVSAPVVTAYAPTPETSSYRVQSGDTLRSIASSLGTTPDAIVRANSLINPDVIFVGSTLVVPVSQSAPQPAIAKANQPAPAESTRVLAEIRTAGPEEALSVGGEELTKQDLLGSIQGREGRDPYVANLLAEVEEVRNQSVEVSEAESVEIEADAAVSAESQLIARADSSDRISRLNVAGQETSAPEAVEAPVGNRANSRVEASSDLLAAAPLSPDAYIPAQRSAGQVVSPDMPILPSADEYLPDAPDYFNGYMWPTQGTVTSGFGWRWGRMHSGVDVAGPVGTPVVAAATGVVEQAGWNSGGYGNLVEIRHPDGSLTRYAHNSSLNVSAGQHVKQGQQIAAMGSTGYSTGPHLHFEVHQGGSAVNPVAYLPGR